MMDDPQLNRDAHVDALRGLARIYCFSRTGAAVWPWIRREAGASAKPLRVLDIATGGGDLPIDLARRARREGLAVEVAGCDCSSRAIAFARLRAYRARTDVRFFTFDTRAQPLPAGYHVITTGLFLHHLSDAEAVSLLRDMAEVTARAVLVDDLRRSRRGLWLARLATRALSRSPVVHVDGPRSVRAAFTSGELSRLAAQAGLTGAEIVPHWPERHLLAWRRV
jgi:2-polyprenyl-3-methyl-5-hydroxy-6-metoxy-1,4-benzoquinol methylase